MDREFRSLVARLEKVNTSYEAMREAAWRAFDIVCMETDPTRASALAEVMCEELANARGDSAVRVYRQRGRDMVRFRVQIANMSRQISPLSHAKRLREKLPKDHLTDLELINTILSSNRATQDAVIELVLSGRLR